MSASRVRRELDELREKGLTSNQRNKIKDFSMPVTTPEQAAAFLASMRDKNKSGGSKTRPPAHISSDGYDAWYMQQKAREREIRKRRKEAEAILHGYRMRMDEKGAPQSGSRGDDIFSPTEYENGIVAINTSPVEENWANFDNDTPESDVKRLNLAQYFPDTPVEGDSLSGATGRHSFGTDLTSESESRDERSKLGRHSFGGSTFTDGTTSLAETPKFGPESYKTPTYGPDGQQVFTFQEEKKNENLNPVDEKKEETYEEDGESTDSDSTGSKSTYYDKKNIEKARSPASMKNGAIPTPAKNLVPDETEWRDFISLEEGAKYPPESGRYHLYASAADPGSHRCLILRAIKGLNNVVSATIVHPTWRRTNPEDLDDGHRGWVFGDPDGLSFTNASGRGGPFPPAYPGNEPDENIGAACVKDVYEHSGDTAKKYVVPILWDKKLKTIVNNDSSDIAYMFNSRLNDFAEEPDTDLYTESDPEPLWDVDDWIQPLMINGFYKCGFAKTQAKYESAIKELTMAYDRADDVLQKKRFLTGDTLTDADVRLFCTLLRFDEVYAFYFKANTRLVMLTPALLDYCRDIYQMTGVAETCDMRQIKAHFFGSHPEWNKYSIIPKGMNFVNLLSEPHARDQMFAGSFVDEDEDEDSSI